jgi:hypothetical protein
MSCFVGAIRARYIARDDIPITRNRSALVQIDGRGRFAEATLGPGTLYGAVPRPQRRGLIEASQLEAYA